jgi:hypothetical protein
MAEYGIGNIHNYLARKGSKSQPSSRILMLTVFGTHKTQYWNVIRRGLQ